MAIVTEKLKTKLVPDWRQSWRWLSVQLSIFGTILMASWPLIPDDLRSEIPGTRYIAMLLFALIVFGRYVDQGKRDV